MALARIIDGKVAAYPYATLRADNPATGFPTSLAGVDLSPFGVVEVAATEKPATTAGEIAVEGEPVNNKGQWQQSWTVRKKTEAELDAAKAMALAELASLRYTKETAGIAFGGATIPTDRQTCSILTGAYVQAAGNAAFAIKFKSPDGTFTPINAAQIIAVGNAVTAHVQACFAHESDLADAIKAARTFAELAAVDMTAGWPK